VVEQTNTLINEASELPQKEIKWRWEAINRDIMRGMLSSEQKVKAKQFKYEWSVELDHAGYWLQYWRMRYLDIQNNSTSHKALGNLFKLAAMKEGDNDITWDLKKVKGMQQEAQKELKEIQKRTRKREPKACRKDWRKKRRSPKNLMIFLEKTVKRIKAIICSE
jgi:hypothetical protein